MEYLIFFFFSLTYKQKFEKQTEQILFAYSLWGQHLELIKWRFRSYGPYLDNVHIVQKRHDRIVRDTGKVVDFISDALI